jgi:cytochrome P450
MKYLETVVKESMRLYPAAPSIAREMTEDVLIGIKCVLYKNSNVFSQLKNILSFGPKKVCDTRDNRRL